MFTIKYTKQNGKLPPPLAQQFAKGGKVQEDRKIREEREKERLPIHVPMGKKLEDDLSFDKSVEDELKDTHVKTYDY